MYEGSISSISFNFCSFVKTNLDMKTTSLLYNNEPTDKELAKLMKDVLVDVKKRAKLASKNFKELQKKEIIASKKRYENYILNGI
jgi:hypothetical protein